MLTVQKHYKCQALDKVSLDIETREAQENEHVPYDIPTEIGIEIEIERVIKATLFKNAHYVEDGSLRNAGTEIVSNPLNGTTLAQFLFDYLEFLKQNKFCEFSHRCSIHVHLNVQTLTLDQLKALYATYIATENLLFTRVDPNRKGNTYCFPLADTDTVWETIKERANLNEDFKYCALNPHHLRDFGTIEFRHHHGTKNITELLQWIACCCAYYSFVTTNEPKNIYNMIMNLNTTSQYDEFVKMVFNKENLWKIFQGDKYSLMRDNVTSAKVFLGEE